MDQKINKEYNWDQFKKEFIENRLRIKKQIKKELSNIEFLRSINYNENTFYIKFKDNKKDYLIKTIEYLIYNNMIFKVEINDLVFELDQLSISDITGIVDFLNYHIIYD